MAKLTYAQKSKLILIGQRMSNFFFNIKQEKDTPAYIREAAEKFVDDWDSTKFASLRGKETK